MSTKTYRYEVTWLTQEGKIHEEEFKAAGYEILPNGVAMFYTIPNVVEFKLTPAPGEGDSPPKVDIVGTAAGFIAIHLL